MLSKKTKAIAAVFLVLIGTLAGLFLAELLLRVLAPQWLRARMNDLNLRRNVEEFGSDAAWSVERIDGKFVQFTPHTQFHIATEEYENDAHIDEWGGRSVSRNSNDQKEIVPFLGDSFMFGIGVKDDETFVSLLHRGASARFLNLGVPGSALPNHLDILEMRYRELGSPKFAVFSFYTGNDYVDIAKYYTDPHSRGRESQLMDSWALRALQSGIVRFHMLGRSYLVGYIKQALLSVSQIHKQNAPRQKAWLIRLPNGRHIAKEAIVLMDKHQEVRKTAELYLEKSLERLRQFCHQNDITPFFIVIPDKVQIDPDLLNQKLAGSGLDPSRFERRMPDEIVDQALERHRIEYFDLFDCLNGKRGQYYGSDDHFTPEGAKTAATCIVDPLKRFFSKHEITAAPIGR